MISPYNMEFILILLPVAALYFLPSIVAEVKNHHSSGLVFLVNLLAGWTLIGWIAALIWAGSGPFRSASGSVVTRQTHVRCPDCAELVLREAKICKHCGCKLKPQ